MVEIGSTAAGDDSDELSELSAAHAEVAEDHGVVEDDIPTSSETVVWKAEIVSPVQTLGSDHVDAWVASPACPPTLSDVGDDETSLPASCHALVEAGTSRGGLPVTCTSGGGLPGLAVACDSPCPCDPPTSSMPCAGGCSPV